MKWSIAYKSCPHEPWYVSGETAAPRVEKDFLVWKVICLECTHLHEHRRVHSELPGKEMAGVTCCTLDAMLLSVACRVLHQQAVVLCSYQLGTVFFITCTGHSSNSSSAVSSAICTFPITHQPYHPQ